MATETEQPIMQTPQMGYRPLHTEDENAELKRWELDPDDELAHLKKLLYGIIKTTKNDKGETVPELDKEGKEIYIKQPIVNPEGAEEIFNFVYEHTNKIIALGYYEIEIINRQVYSSMVSFSQAVLENYEKWDLEFSNVYGLHRTIYALVYSSYTRGLKGNEKLYRSKTHTSHDHKVVQQATPMQPHQESVGIVRKMLRRFR